MENTLDARKAAEILGVTVKTLQRCEREGKLFLAASRRYQPLRTKLLLDFLAERILALDGFRLIPP